MAGMLHLGDFIRVAHDPVDLIAEPHIHGLIHEAAGHKCQEDRGDERKSDKGGYKLGAKPRPEQSMTALEVGLNDVAREQKQEYDKADQIEIDQQQDERIARGREKRIRIVAARYDHLAVVKR